MSKQQMQWLASYRFHGVDCFHCFSISHYDKAVEWLKERLVELLKKNNQSEETIDMAVDNLLMESRLNHQFCYVNTFVEVDKNGIVHDAEFQMREVPLN